MIKGMFGKSRKRDGSHRVRAHKRTRSFESLESRVLFDAYGLSAIGGGSGDPSGVAALWSEADGEASTSVASVEIAPGPVRSINVVFSQPMALASSISSGTIRSAVSIVNLQEGPVDLTNSSFRYFADTQTLTWTSNSVLAPGLYEIRLNGAAMADTGGNPLHGGTGGLSFSLPDYASSEDVQVGVDAIDVDSYSVPTIVDWNADGVRDLVVGEKTVANTGKVRVYLNTGTAESPTFDTFFYAQQNGQDLTTVAGTGCLGAFPRVFDWDQDGAKDLLVGLADGRIQVFLNVASDDAPAFGSSSYVQVGAAGAKTDLDIGARAAFDIVDWNNDGREDLVIGALDGKVRVYLDTATSGVPDFASATTVLSGASELVVSSGRSSVAVADLNQDGRKDLLLGNTDGQLFFYANVGSDTAPAFGSGQAISVDGIPLDLAGTPRSRPFIGSFEFGGLPDLWVGEETGLVHHYAVTSWLAPVDAPIQEGAAGTTFVFAFESLQSEWMNPFDPNDVNDDGFVVPGDVLYIINELNNPTVRDELGELPLTRPYDETFYFDTNGDGYCSPRDALLVINFINSPVDPGEGEASFAGDLASLPAYVPADAGQFAIASPQTHSNLQRSVSSDDYTSADNYGAVSSAQSASVDYSGDDVRPASDYRLDDLDFESLLSLLAADR